MHTLGEGERGEDDFGWLDLGCRRSDSDIAIIRDGSELGGLSEMLVFYVGASSVGSVVVLRVLWDYWG